MRKKATLYPFYDEQIPIFLYNNFFNDEYVITSAVAPMCIKNGIDISYIDNRMNVGISIKYDLFNELEDVDALFIPSSKSKESLVYNDIFDIMMLAVKRGKDIVCNFRLEEQKIIQIEDACKKKMCKFRYSYNVDLSWLKHAYRNWSQILVPVIWVGQLSFEANNTEILLHLAKKFKEDGYKVSLLGMRPEYNLYGYHFNIILDELENGKIFGGDISHLILFLNYWANYIVNKEKADILLMDIPGATIENELYSNESGVYNYIASRAIEPDYAIGTCLYNEVKGEVYEEINKAIERRFDYFYNCFHISNIQTNVEETILLKKLAYMYLPLQIVTEKLPVKSDKISLYNLLDEKQFDEMYKEMINKLGKL